MLFETTYQTMGYTLEPSEGGIVVSMAVGTVLPISQGPDQPPIPLPLGTVKFPMGRQDALNLASAIQEAAENLPEEQKPSNLVVADRMPNIDVNGLEKKLRAA